MCTPGGPSRCADERGAPVGARGDADHRGTAAVPACRDRLRQRRRVHQRRPDQLGRRTTSFCTRARPYHSNDNAHIEQKNGDVVRRHVFHYRYDTPTELGCSTSSTPSCGCGSTCSPRPRRPPAGRNAPAGGESGSTTPRTPFQRGMDSGVVAPSKAEPDRPAQSRHEPRRADPPLGGSRPADHLAAAKTAAHSCYASKTNEARDAPLASKLTCGTTLHSSGSGVATGVGVVVGAGSGSGS